MCEHGPISSNARLKFLSKLSDSLVSQTTPKKHHSCLRNPNPYTAFHRYLFPTGSRLAWGYSGLSPPPSRNSSAPPPTVRIEIFYKYIHYIYYMLVALFT